MNYLKKMCVLRQIKQGFSGDGKPLSGLVKIEQYGKNLAVEVSIINFAPLSTGEYYCLLSDGKGKTEMLRLRGKSLFNLLSDVDISMGFCAIVCYVKNEVIPIAYGINGKGVYDWKTILNATLPPVFPKTEQENAISKSEEELGEKWSEVTLRYKYDDDAVSKNNYYEEAENECEQLSQIEQNASIESANQEQTTEEGVGKAEDGDAQSIRQAVEINADGYYWQVKGEIDELFKRYPTDDTLCRAFSNSEWVRIKGDAGRAEYLVGVLYEDGKAQYICYALSATNKAAPPEEIKNVCTYVPTSCFCEEEGFFVIFQSASTGECIKGDRL